MAFPTASALKVNAVLEIARKDRGFADDLHKNTARTLLESGIDLSPGEVLGIVDVVQGTEHSVLSPYLGESREKWTYLQKD